MHTCTDAQKECETSGHIRTGSCHYTLSINTSQLNIQNNTADRVLTPANPDNTVERVLPERKHDVMGKLCVVKRWREGAAAEEEEVV